MRLLFSMTILICLIGTSCEEDDRVNIVIKTGRDCGWCGGSDSLVITKFTSRYEFYSNCDVPGNKERDAITNREEWNELLSRLNWDDFKEINVNTCARCADGCDTWIFIEKNDEIHRIQFTENSPEIEPIQAFVERLAAVHEEFRNN